MIYLLEYLVQKYGVWVLWLVGWPLMVKVIDRTALTITEDPGLWWNRTSMYFPLVIVGILLWVKTETSYQNGGLRYLAFTLWMLAAPLVFNTAYLLLPGIEKWLMNGLFVILIWFGGGALFYMRGMAAEAEAQKADRVNQ